MRVIIFLFCFCCNFLLCAQKIEDVTIKIYKNRIEIKEVSEIILGFRFTDSTFCNIEKAIADSDFDSTIFDKINSIAVIFNNDTLMFYQKDHTFEIMRDFGLNMYKEMLTKKEHSNWELNIYTYPFSALEIYSQSVKENIFSKKNLKLRAKSLDVKLKKMIVYDLVLSSYGNSFVFGKEKEK